MFGGGRMVQSLKYRLLALLGWWTFPVGVVSVFTAVGLILERVGIVKGFYASPFVLAVVLASLRSGRTGGYLGALLSAVAFNFVFVHPQFSFTIPSTEEWLAYGSMFGAAYVVGGIRHTPPQQTDIDRYSGGLPFVRDNDTDSKDRRVFWDVESSGVWLDDCTVGHQYGQIFMARRMRYGAPILSWIVRDMIRAGRYTGVEAGFVSAVASSMPQASRITLIANHNAAESESN